MIQIQSTTSGIMLLSITSCAFTVNKFKPWNSKQVTKQKHHGNEQG